MDLTKIPYLRISWYFKYNFPSQIDFTRGKDKVIKITTHSYKNR